MTENNKLRKIEVIFIILLCFFSILFGILLGKIDESIKAVQIDIFEDNCKNKSF